MFATTDAQMVLIQSYLTRFHNVLHASGHASDAQMVKVVHNAVPLSLSMNQSVLLIAVWQIL